MSVYSNKTEQDFNNLHKLAEQQKNQRVLKIEGKISKQTHDVKFAESLSPITKKLDIITNITENLGDVIKESNLKNDNLKSLPKSSNFSSSMRQMLGSLMNSRNSLKITGDEFGQANVLGISIQITGGDRVKANEIFF